MFEQEDQHEPGRMERALSRPVPLWGVLLTSLLLMATAIGFGAIVDGWEKAGRLGHAAIGIARAPDTVMGLFKDAAPIFRGDYQRLPGGFTRDASFADTGYALISPFDPARGRSVVQLLRLGDGAVAHEFVPDVDAANAASRFTSAHIDVRRDKDAPRNRLMHPLLLADGGLVIHDSTPLARYDACGKLV
ncbi:MAG: hypothetical protein EOP59_19415, partial [Sphingomonadales bacterium]